MLTLINDRLTRNVFDDVMEVAWSTMWNVTDETAINCERFLDGQGMDFFLWCLRVCLYSVIYRFCCILISYSLLLLVAFAELSG